MEPGATGKRRIAKLNRFVGAARDWRWRRSPPSMPWAEEAFGAGEEGLVGAMGLGAPTTGQGDERSPATDSAPIASGGSLRRDLRSRGRGKLDDWRRSAPRWRRKEAELTRTNHARPNLLGGHRPDGF